MLCTLIPFRVWCCLYPQNVITMRRIIFTPAPPSHPKIGKLIGEIAPMYQIFSPSSLFVSPLTLKGFNGRNRSVASKWHYFWLPPPLPLIQETEPSPAKLRKTESRHRSIGNTQTPSPTPPTHTHIFRKIMTPIFLMFFFGSRGPRSSRVISPSGGCINLVCLQSVRVYPNRFIQLDIFVIGDFLKTYRQNTAQFLMKNLKNWVFFKIYLWKN